MQKHIVLVFAAVVGLVASFAGGYVIRDSQAQSSLPQNEHAMHDMDMSSTMSGMTSSLLGKSGEEFDRAFLQEMIVHHEGAVEMAKQALVSASHTEIKQMAQDIITAQTKEIAQMKEWQTQWQK